MLRLFSAFILLLSIVYAEGNSTLEQNSSNVVKKAEINSKNLELIKQIKDLREQLISLNKKKKTDNEWTKIYSSYMTHKALLDKEKNLAKKIEKLKKIKHLKQEQKELLAKLEKEDKVLQDKISLIKDFDKDPFKKLITPPSLSDAPEITNPFSLISGLSYIKELASNKEKYLDRYKQLEDTISSLEKQRYLLSKIVNLNNNEIDKQHIKFLNQEIKHLLTIKDIFKTTKNIYIKKADELKLSIENDIKKELKKVVYVGVIALVFLIIFIFLKFLTRKYLADKESFYTVNKVINISFITVLILTILFAYLENVSYIVTILGFASAGIAIALKDWFMSLLGWFVIVIGGTIHVGDRVKFVRGNTEYVGDVVDISLLRMTIQEDITLTTYMHNRRAGRIIFVPNNYVFTDMIANYSHSGLKTVWDGIDFYITFDSNISKATSIAKNVAKQYSKGYTDITRKQLNKLRSKYQLKNTNVEPRVFSFIEGYGVKVSVWYLTNAYATLTLRSTISTNILKEILEAEDIKIAYPTQSFYIDNEIPKPKQAEEMPAPTDKEA